MKVSIYPWVENEKEPAYTWVLEMLKQHFGHKTSSRIEGSHSCLKKAVSAAHDLDMCFVEIDRVLRISDSNKEIERGWNLLSNDVFLLNKKKYSQLLGKVSKFAINSIRQSIENTDHSEKCSCLLRKNFDLPYTHEISSFRSSFGTVICRKDEIAEVWFEDEAARQNALATAIVLDGQEDPCIVPLATSANLLASWRSRWRYSAIAGELL